MARHLVQDNADFMQAFNWLEASELVCADTETTGLVHFQDMIVGVSAWARGESFYFPFRHVKGTNLSDGALTDLGNMLHSRPHLIGYNYQYDVKMWQNEDVDLPPVWEDPILMAHLCNENEPSFKMEKLAARYVDPNAAKDEAALIAELCKRFPSESKKTIKQYIGYVEPEIAGPYAMQDVETTLDLYMHYVPWLKAQGLWELYKEQRYFAREIAAIELRGFPLDNDRLEVNSKGAVEEAARLKAILSKQAGHVVNPNSYPQMQTLLGVPSTARPKLEIAAGIANPKIKGAEELLLWRQYSKAEGTYYQPFRELQSPEGHIHTNLRMVGSWKGEDEKGGTVSGRLSAQHPNMQAIKRGSGKNFNVRDVFVASLGKKLVEVDYSQAELRLACHYAGVAEMSEMFRQGKDIHQGVADDLSIPRSMAKNVNFSFLYGIGPKSFAEKYYMGFREARKYLEKYNAKYPGFKRLFRMCEQFAKKYGYIEMWTGRRRHFGAPGVWEKDGMNALIQGGVGEMIRKSICAIGPIWPEEVLRMILTVHDSIMFEITDDESMWPSIFGQIRTIMEPQPWCSVPIKVDFKVGDRWGEMEEYTR